MNRSQPLYFDFNASTPPDPEVVEAMMPWLGASHANPHAEHVAGRRAAQAIDRALDQVGTLLGVDPVDLIITSGATESNNLALQGLINGQAELWHSTIEHKSIIEVARHLEASGVEVRKIPVDRYGRVNLQNLSEALQGRPVGRRIISVMHANNEIGTVQPIARLSTIANAGGAFVHVDAAQSAGMLPISAQNLGLDLVSLSAHKLYGPAGIGALYVSPRVKPFLRPILFGGGQQQGFRSGTVPVFLAVGFGAACALAQRRMQSDAKKVEGLAAHFCGRLTSLGTPFELLGDPNNRLPGLRSIRIPGVDADDLVARASPTMSISTGSACSAGELLSSHVLQAIGLTDSEARGVIRVGFGRPSTIEQADSAAETLAAMINSSLDSCC